MTILYGTNGALIQTAGAQLVPNRFKDGSETVLLKDTVQFTSANVIGDQVFMGAFKSNTYLDPAAVCWFDAFGTGVTMNIGDVNHAAGLASALAISSAGSANIWKGFTAAKMLYPLWQALGYSSDPGGLLTLYGTIAGANVVSATANFAWKMNGQQA